MGQCCRCFFDVISVLRLCYSWNDWICFSFMVLIFAELHGFRVCIAYIARMFQSTLPFPSSLPLSAVCLSDICLSAICLCLSVICLSNVCLSAVWLSTPLPNFNVFFLLTVFMRTFSYYNKLLLPQPFSSKS